ncbi:MAG: LptF/LptG family permease [Bacteroidia bacterium]|nr:LptF/LptG family permease [Bacteroidia bacterium]MBP9688151.1 LptF/LptG family permease [Bacteroidia bacterium]
MKTIDRYIIKKFLITFVFALGLFALIAIFIDISEKIDDFLKRKPPFFVVVFDYYIYFLPYFFGMFSPIFVFLSAMFFNSKLAQNTEIIAILNSGISYRRFLRPYLISAGLLAAVFLYLNTMIIPYCDKKRYAFEEEWIKERKTTQSNNISFVVEPGTILHLESFNYIDSTGYNVSIERFENFRVSQRIFANRLLWNRETQNWRLEYYQRRLFKDSIEIIEKGNFLDTTLRISPDEFIVKSQFVSSMTNPELNEYIRREKEKGSPNISKYYVELYKRIATPFSFFILTLLAVAISSKKSRGGTGVALGIGIFLTFTFLLVIQVFNTLGITHVLPPAIAVWTPNVMFLIVALIMTKLAPK